MNGSIVFRSEGHGCGTGAVHVFGVCIRPVLGKISAGIVVGQFRLHRPGANAVSFGHLAVFIRQLHLGNGCVVLIHHAHSRYCIGSTEGKGHNRRNGTIFGLAGEILHFRQDRLGRRNTDRSTGADAFAFRSVILDGIDGEAAHICVFQGAGRHPDQFVAVLDGLAFLHQRLTVISGIQRIPIVIGHADAFNILGGLNRQPEGGRRFRIRGGSREALDGFFFRNDHVLHVGECRYHSVFHGRDQLSHFAAAGLPVRQTNTRQQTADHQQDDQNRQEHTATALFHFFFLLVVVFKVVGFPWDRRLLPTVLAINGTALRPIGIRLFAFFLRDTGIIFSFGYRTARRNRPLGGGAHFLASRAALRDSGSLCGARLPVLGNVLPSSRRPLSRPALRIRCALRTRALTSARSRAILGL